MTRNATTVMVVGWKLCHSVVGLLLLCFLLVWELVHGFLVTNSLTNDWTTIQSSPSLAKNSITTTTTTTTTRTGPKNPILAGRDHHHHHHCLVNDNNSIDTHNSSSQNDMHNNSSSSSSHSHRNEEKDIWLWCALKRYSTRRLFHFPHAAQSLLPCWSWFERMRSNLTNTTTTTTTTTVLHCGFWLIEKNYPTIALEGWVGQLIEHMGCSISETEPPCYSSASNSGNAMFYFLPRDVLHDYQWFERPQDATSLRMQVLQSINFTDNHGTTAAAATATNHRHDALRIAIIDRRSTRKLLNVDNVSSSLRHAYPLAAVEIAYMEDMEPTEQFLFWSRQDIIIAGHGAALTNTFFLPPGNTSALIEIFPPHFYDVTFFRTLRNSAGIRGYGYYNNESDLQADWAKYSNTMKKRKYYRLQDLEPPVDAILDLVRQALVDGGHDIINPNQ